MKSTQADDQQRTPGFNSPDDLLRAFADQDVRRLFYETETPKTVPQLVAESGIPRSTAYRKIELLEDGGLVVTAEETGTDDRSPTEYRRAVDEIVIRIRNEMAIEYMGYQDEQVVGADASK